jgi:exodeoxyribonuclease VII large subunit
MTTNTRIDLKVPFVEVPVFTGIGHERDNTILDEIAHTRFDTPSKVALHISTTIKDNALAAISLSRRTHPS